MSDKKNNKYAFSVYSYVDPEMQNNYFEYDGKDWVAWGEANLYPYRIIDLYNSSAINHTCIVAKVDAICGKGLKSENVDADARLKRANPKESWDEVMEKVALDYEMFGGFALNVIWNRAGDKIAEVYHMDFSTLRSGKKNEDYEVTEYWYTPRWDLHNLYSRRKQYKPVAYPAFDPENTTEDNASQVFYYYNYEPGREYYPMPSYVGGLNDIEIDKELSLFHAANLNNGLTPSMFISMNNGVPDKETRDALYREFQESYAGAGNAGRFFLTFSDTKETAPEITPLSLTNDTYYLQLEARLSSRILTSHRISSPLLLGIREGGSGLGSNSQELLMAFNHFSNTVVKPDQDVLLKQFNKMFKYMGIEDANLEIEPQALLDEDIIIAEDVPEKEVVETDKQEAINPNTGDPLMEDLKSKLLSGIPKNMQ